MYVFKLKTPSQEETKPDRSFFRPTPGKIFETPTSQTPPKA